MSLDAGTTVRGDDYPPTAGDFQSGSFTFNATTFGIDADSGTYNDCGAAFQSNTVGAALVFFDAEMDADGAAVAVEVAPVVRLGATVGSGSVFLAADSTNAIRSVGTLNPRFGAHYLLTGLTPLTVYNVRLEHRASGGTNNAIQRRRVTVTPVNI